MTTIFTEDEIDGDFYVGDYIEEGRANGRDEQGRQVLVSGFHFWQV